eukprot:CAMPEP_0202029526 /NCGR_PEP_ID=MMETSP0905-20130828/64023_1 /ASSEMBLY_ACC=CAM_ASM_000554 /TAXON_ID=420261 /ORGANISM="Thalassiosira antarctica, Strain CCMP982" /LENGTH=584 /DNA_ID=CAMNT_0048593289 /DNA_START=71 /DNA_END=1826 /DNA_ORIENTATION=-
MNYQTQTEAPGPGRGRALLAAALLFFTAGAASLLVASSIQSSGDNNTLNTASSISTPDEATNNNGHRSLSVSLPHGGCMVTYGKMAEYPIAPTWQASFPGSGSRMTWSLVEALTGIRTNDDYDSHERGYERVVAVKTHYPVKNARNRFDGLDPLFGRAIVILRNPINAVPSSFPPSHPPLPQHKLTTFQAIQYTQTLPAQAAASMNDQAHTETPGRGRALLAAALLFFTASAASLYVTSNNSPPQTNSLNTALPISTPEIDDINNHRSLSVALQDGGCMVTYAKMTSYPIPPVWQASFPGSGARMTWTLVEALTGIRTNNDYDSQGRGYEHVVAVKTHYPVKDARRRFGDLDPLFGRAIVILRNPINAVPSYFNLQYEHLNHLPNHSTRGPNEDWIIYRDDPSSGLPYQIPSYESFVEYWMDKYPEPQQLLMISYEDLTDSRMGPIAAARIASFLGETEGVNPIAAGAVPCVWETIVNYKNVAPPTKKVYTEAAAALAETAPPVEEVDFIRGKNRRRLGLAQGKTHADPSSLRTGPKVRPYTGQNLADMVAMFQRLVEKYNHDEDFVRIMGSYIETVSNTAPQD